MSDIVESLTKLKTKLEDLFAFTEEELERVRDAQKNIDDIIRSVSQLEGHVQELGERDV